jgi:hypothetical protein
MKSLLKILLITTIIFLFVRCTTTEPPDPPPVTKPTLTLELDDASCIEAWLQLKTTALTLPAELILKQFNPNGDSTTQTISLSTKDSLLYIDSLLPNETYSFQVSSIQSATGGQVFSIKQPVTTMDTTSHNFSWQTFTFGGGGSSGLFDIAIIDENNIWAVGEILIADTSINGYTVYNAVHWNGSNWELKQIPFNYNGQTFYSAIKSILAFNENDIWFGIASLIHWNGSTYHSINTSSFFPSPVNKMWGTISNNFYIVGTNGQIAHYNGTNWQRIESGTTTDIANIYGFSEFSNTEVICLSSNPYTTEETKLFRLNNNIAEELPQLGLQWGMSDLWFVSNKKHYVVGNGIHIKKDVNSSIETWQKITNPPPANYYSCSIDGQSYNDIIISGASGEVVHFNGYSWKNYRQEIGLMFGLLEECKISKNVVVAVGYDGVNAIIVVGKRN